MPAMNALPNLRRNLGTWAVDASTLPAVAEALSAFLFGGPYREVAGLVLFVVILVARPRGLFGR